MSIKLPAILGFLCYVLCLPPAHAAGQAAKVLDVLDDAVVVLEGRDGPLRYGLAGVKDSPDDDERATLTGFLRNLLLEERVEVRVVRDAVDGSHAQVYLWRAPDGLFVNLEAVRQGYARVGKDVDEENRESFEFYSARARRAGKGVWREHVRQAADVRQAPRQDEPEKPKEQATGSVVYVTKSGRKYHAEGCSYLSSSSRPIPLEEAKKRYEPCSRCKPPQ